MTENMGSVASRLTTQRQNTIFIYDNDDIYYRLRSRGIVTWTRWPSFSMQLGFLTRTAGEQKLLNFKYSIMGFLVSKPCTNHSRRLGHNKPFTRTSYITQRQFLNGFAKLFFVGKVKEFLKSKFVTNIHTTVQFPSSCYYVDR